MIETENNIKKINYGKCKNNNIGIDLGEFRFDTSTNTIIKNI